MMKLDEFDTKLSAGQIISLIIKGKSDFWSRIRETRPLRIFHGAARRVPAYKDFLKKHKINPDKIKNFKDFQLVPSINKQNYLRQYPLEELCWDGHLEKPLVFSSTTGSTGQPFYFPRNDRLDWESSIIHQIFFENGIRKNSGSTLVVIGFGMGAWIGGLITYKAFEMAAHRSKYPISIITPGVNKIEVFNVLKNLAPHYKQVILTGYPPFIKDILDEAPGQGINLKKFNLRFLFAAEPFTEKFRDYITKKGNESNPYLDTLNIYGTADIGTMAYETPATILIRRISLENKKFFSSIFSNTIKIPTLAQYNPYFITFESPDRQVLITGNASIPLIRYSLGDNGITYDFEEIRSKLEEMGIDFQKEVKKMGLGNHIYELPLVSVFERSDFAVKLHLRDIYPESIRDALINRNMAKVLTGRFTMLTKYNKDHNQYLEINLETKKFQKANNKFKKLVCGKILHSLSKKTTGPGSPSEFIKRPNLLKIIFWPQEHPIYFGAGIKQKWVKK